MNEKENHLPNLSDKERAHALELAMKARKRRAVLKARMKSGELAFTDALNEEDAKRIDRNGIAWCYLIDYELGRIPDFTKGNQVTPVICLETRETIRDAKPSGNRAWNQQG